MSDDPSELISAVATEAKLISQISEIASAHFNVHTHQLSVIEADLTGIAQFTGLVLSRGTAQHHQHQGSKMHSPPQY